MGQDCNQRLLAPVYPLVEPESLQSGGSRRNTKVCIVVVLIPPRVWYGIRKSVKSHCVPIYSKALLHTRYRSCKHGSLIA